MEFFKKLFAAAPQPADCEAAEERSEDEAAHEADYEFETLRDDGVRALKLAAYGRAETYFKGALERRDDPEVRGFLAEVYLRSGRGDEAKELLKQLAAEQPDSQQLWQAQALAADMAADEELLLSAGNKLKELAPELPNGGYYIARSQMISKQYAEAVETLGGVLQEHADHAETLLLRAQALVELERYADAEKDVDRLLATDHRGADVLVLKARLRQVQGDTEGAKQAYLELREADPFNLSALQGLTDLYIETGQAAEALAMLNEAIDWQPEEAAGYAMRSRVYEVLAASDAAKAQELKPDADLTPCDKQRLRDKLNDEARQRNPFGF